MSVPASPKKPRRGNNSPAQSGFAVRVRNPDGVATHFLGGATSVATDSAGGCAVLGGGMRIAHHRHG